MKARLSSVRELIREELSDTRPKLDPRATIYCDMDGVLVDFAAGAITLASEIITGKSHAEWTKQSKSMRRSLNTIHTDFGDEWVPTSPGDLNKPAVRQLMFSAISFNPGGFFSGLEPLPDGLSTLWPHITSSGYRVELLTAPVQGRTKGNFDVGMSAGEGKKLWADNWLRPAPANVIISPARSKPNNAVSNGIANVLIDDKASTIDAWNDATEQAGLGRGYGILHITGDSTSTIEKLGKLL